MDAGTPTSRSDTAANAASKPTVRQEADWNPCVRNVITVQAANPTATTAPHAPREATAASEALRSPTTMTSQTSYTNDLTDPVSAANSCLGGNRAGCATGIVGAAAGGASLGLGRVTRIAPNAAKSRLSVRSWHVVKRRATGPSLRMFSDWAGRAARTLNVVRCATSVEPIAWKYRRLR